MKPFRFNLQALLTVRQRREQLAMEHYARALQDQRAALAALNEVQSELEAAWNAWNAALAEGCTAALICQTQNYFQRVEGRRQACLGSLRRCEQEVQDRLQDMLEARREREAVDAFFSNQRAEYDRALQLEERKALDEMAQRRSGAALLWPAKPVVHD